MPTPVSPVSPGLARVAVLDRTIGASLERVVENVLDWEHLPWLHGSAFASIELDEAGDFGWRARVTMRARPEAELGLEVLVERDALRYVSRTRSGPGAGSEIWTWLDPTSDASTRIHVEFWLPGVPESQREAIGAGYLRLYRRLWDEDESMMRERTAQLALRARRGDAGAPRALELGPRAELLARAPLRVELGGAHWRIARLGDELVVHDARCPHLFGPLGGEACGASADAAAGEVVCPWHGYRFDVRSGRSSDGRRLRLRRAPKLVHDGASDRISLVLE